MEARSLACVCRESLLRSLFHSTAQGDRGVRYTDVPKAEQVADVVHALRDVSGLHSQMEAPEMP